MGGLEGLGDFNSEPNKKLRFTPLLASRGTVRGTAAGGAAAAKHGTAGERQPHSTDKRGRFGRGWAEVRVITGKRQVDYGVNLG